MSHLQRPPPVPAEQTAQSWQSLVGCFYRVVQTPGPQGTNVLNLLPVPKPKEKPILTALLAPSPPPPAPCAPVLHVPQPPVPSPAPVSLIPRPSPLSVPLVQTPTLGNYFISTKGNTLHVENQLPVFQEATLFLDNRGQLTLPAKPVPGNPPTFIMVNTKPPSPIKPMPQLPSGHSLQIPSHAEVMSVPISSLPVCLQQKILPQLCGSDISKVIYVSPVHTVKTGAAQSSQPNPSPNSKSPSQIRPPSRGSETPKGPMKWVVQEDQESAACIVPLKSSNDTACKILELLKKTKMEDVNVTNPYQPKVVQIKENSLVMCNNKIYYLTKKSSEAVSTGAKIPEPPQFMTPEKSPTKMKPMNELSNKVVQVLLAKNKSPSSEASVQSNVVDSAKPKPKRKSSTPRAVRDDLSTLYMPEDSGSNVSRELWSAPPSAATTAMVNAANKGDLTRITDHGAAKEQPPLSDSKKTEMATGPKTPEMQGMDERSWRLKFGLLKKEKIILKRIPVIRALGTSDRNADPPGESGALAEDPVATTKKQLKRKSSLSGDDTKMQKRWESDDVSRNVLDQDVSSPDPWVATHASHQDTSEPPDTADFPLSPDTEQHYSDILFSSPRFHIDSMYPDETTKDEKIQRLKEVLKEREDAVEALRRRKI